jgi:pimeloyl-ACP methyl ester carboxylesterase
MFPTPRRWGFRDTGLHIRDFGSLPRAPEVKEDVTVRASAQWHRRLTERFAPKEPQRGVVHLRHYPCEYSVVGNGDPIVLVPGLAGGCKLVGRLMRALSDRFQVIAYELRGEHDPVAARRPHGLADLADDLAELQAALLLERPAVLGISFGSAIALEYALRHQNSTGALILHGLAARFCDSLGGRIAHMALTEFPMPHDNPFFNQFFRLLFARRETVGPLFDFVIAQCWSTEQSVMAHRLGLLADFDVRFRLSAVATPTLVVAGEEDSVVSPRRQRAVAESIPDARFVSLARAGHLCFLTRPNAFAHAVVEFFHSSRACPVKLSG